MPKHQIEETGYELKSNFVWKSFSKIFKQHFSTVDRDKHDLPTIDAIFLTSSASLPSNVGKKINLDHKSAQKSNYITKYALLDTMNHNKENLFLYSMRNLTFRIDSRLDIIPNLLGNFIVQPVLAAIEYASLKAAAFLTRKRDNPILNNLALTVGRLLALPLTLVGLTVGIIRRTYDGLVNIPNILMDHNRGAAGIKGFLSGISDLFLPITFLFKDNIKSFLDNAITIEEVASCDTVELTGKPITSLSSSAQISSKAGLSVSKVEEEKELLLAKEAKNYSLFKQRSQVYVEHKQEEEQKQVGNNTQCKKF